MTRPLRVAVLYPAPYLESVPAVRNFILLLAEAGVRTDVFVLAGGSRNQDAGFDHANIRTFRMPERRDRPGLFRFLPNFPAFLPWILKQSGLSKYDYLVGVDPAGLAAAHLLRFLARRGVIYYNLELILASDPHAGKAGMYKGYKGLERRGSRAARYVLIQDEKRGELLAAEYGLDRRRFHYIPNSPLASEAAGSLPGYFHQRFGLPAATKIALFAGSIGAGSWAREVAQIASELPADWVVVFHSRFKMSLPELEERLGVALGNKVHVSGDPLDAREVARIYASCDVGLAFYGETESPNVWYIGKSSGKINYYLMNGKPIVMSPLAGWDGWLNAHGSGLLVNRPSEIPAAIARIDRDYARFSQGALDHFAAELRFEPAFADFMATLVADVSGGAP
jgi:hypothetical protein